MKNPPTTDRALIGGSSRATASAGWHRAAWALALLALAAGVGFGAREYFKADPAAQLATVRVEQGDLEQNVTAVGSVKARDYVDVGAQVSGRVEKVHVRIGARVEKGALIAEIDPTVYQSTVRKSQANLDNLKAQLGQQVAELALARRQLDRNNRLFEGKAVSQDAAEQARAAHSVAEARVTATRAQIKAAEATLAGDTANLNYTKVYAPMSGSIVSQPTLAGQTINASQQAPVIVQIADLDVMTVWAQVAEADIMRIREGMPAYFSTLGMPGKRWQGTVREVRPTPEIKNDVVLYNVLVDVDNRERLLLPSMTVQVFFRLGEAKGVPLVALAALRADRRAAGETWQATVLTDRGTETRTVSVGLTNRTTAQVVSGLAVGERVVLASPAAGEGEAAKAGNAGGAGRSAGRNAPRMPTGPRL